jgi:16S rRNA (guanine527-N7)-methyltransferase
VVALELEKAGVELEDHSALVEYLELLHHWGRRINLTARPDPQIVARRLLPDSLTLAANLDRGIRTAVDVGSGSGILGLVLALCRPRLQLLLVEPNTRRCSFLRTAVHELGLHQVTLLEDRLEHTELLPRDLACSRATWPPAEWLRRGANLIAPGGVVVTFVVRQSDLPVVSDLELQRQVPYSLEDGTPRLLGMYVSRETATRLAGHRDLNSEA